MKLDDLDFLAACTLRDCIDTAIKGHEREIAKPPLKDARPDALAYFERQHQERVTAVSQLKKFRNAVNGQVWQSHVDEAA